MMSRSRLTHRHFYRNAVPVFGHLAPLHTLNIKISHKSVQESKYNFLSTWFPWIKLLIDVYDVLTIK